MATGLFRALIIAGLALSAAACASYPTEPQYSTRPTPVGVRPGPPEQPVYAPPAEEPVFRAPIETIEGGTLPPPVSGGGQPLPGRDLPPPPGSAAASVGAGAGPAMANAYVIQPGDTISGVGRRFRTPVQILIDLNDLGPRAAIAPGQRIVLPGTAIDGGVDPFATGPSPTGVEATNEGLPPPPPPPSGNAPLPPRPVATAPTTGAVALDWPVRGEILRRFGPTGMGSRNNGVNIGAAQGEPVRTSAPGRVAYVGDNLPGQGLTVLVVHRDGWRTTYGHLGSSTVEEGDDLGTGQQIGTVGTTAGDGRPSIHYEVWRMRGDEPLAIDPLTLLPR